MRQIFSSSSSTSWKKLLTFSHFSHSDSGSEKSPFPTAIHTMVITLPFEITLCHFHFCEDISLRRYFRHVQTSSSTPSLSGPWLTAFSYNLMQCSSVNGIVQEVPSSSSKSKPLFNYKEFCTRYSCYPFLLSIGTNQSTRKPLATREHWRMVETLLQSSPHRCSLF